MSLPKPGALARSYKTHLCSDYEEGGEEGCVDGFYCRFAHGVSDLRTVEQNEADGIVNEPGLHKYLSQRQAAQLSQLEEAKEADKVSPSASTPDHYQHGNQASTNEMFGGQSPEEEVALSRLLNDLAVGEDDDEDAVLMEAKAVVQRELLRQMTACGLAVPPELTSSQ